MKLILFGAGYWGETAFTYFGAENIYCFCDNKVKGDEERELNGKRIVSFQKLIEIYRDYVVVVCAGSNYTEEICEELESAGIEDYFDYTVLVSMGQNVNGLMEELQSEHGRDRIFKLYYKSLAKRAKGQFEYLKRHTDITTLKPAFGALRKLQMDLLECTKEFFNFVATLELKPFLVFGNLIGAFRHKGFIPWDDDMDFGLMRNELNRLLDFAEKNCVIGTRCGTIENGMWVGSEEECTWSEVFCRYPNHYIFDIRSDVVQIYKSAYSYERSILDIWVFDFYKSEYDMVEHRKWLDRIAEELKTIETEKDKVEYLKKVWQKNQMISREPTENIFPGIDDFGGHPGRKDVMTWIPAESVFPLKRVIYENTEFWAPNDITGILGYEYPDYMSLPYDIGDPRHSVAEF